MITLTVAAITGYALGGGCELALAADFRIAGRSAVLGLPEITLGIMPGSGGTQRLGRLVGHARAKELILSGRQVQAAEALEIGLVHHVTDDATVLAEAVERGLSYASSPLALRYAKQALDADLPIEAGLALEADPSRSASPARTANRAYAPSQTKAQERQSSTAADDGVGGGSGTGG